MNRDDLKAALAAYAKKASASRKPDKRTSDEIKEAKLGSIAEAKLRRYLIRSEGINNDIDGRKKYAFRTFSLICVWLSSVWLILIFQGFFSFGLTEYRTQCHGVMRIHFHLSDGVILMLLGTSTATVIGLFAVVMHYLFNKDGVTDEEEEPTPLTEEEVGTSSTSESIDETKCG